MLRPDTGDPRVHRVVQAAALGLGIAFALMSLHDGLIWTDGRAYWEAAERLRSGLDLYPQNVAQEAADVYRYAPWFAWAWVPLTFLPEALVAGAWTAAMVAAWAPPVLAFVQTGWRERSLAFLAGPPLLVAALGGNVQPAVVLLLWAGLERRWGPGAIGVAASLKLFPILFVVVYVARGRWVAAAAAVGLGGLLWLPALASDVRAYPAAIGGALSLVAISPVAYTVVVLGAVVLTFGSRSWGWASASVVLASMVRFIPYHLGYLLCSVPLPTKPPTDH
jgi:hypothetical protein